MRCVLRAVWLCSEAYCCVRTSLAIDAQISDKLGLNLLPSSIYEHWPLMSSLCTPFKQFASRAMQENLAELTLFYNASDER